MRPVEDPGELAELFSRDREAHVYGLADLDAPFWAEGRWFRRGDAAVGIVRLGAGEGVAVYAISTADPDGTLALAADLVDDLPAGALVTGPVGLAARFARH